MNGLQALNLVMWFAVLICIWDLSFIHSLITMLVILAYGQTERWLGNEEEK
jgi:hypothetical protein